MLIKIDIRSFWRSGTGAGDVGGIDALCAVDHDSLPYLPGKHLKGLLRDAVAQAVALGRLTWKDRDVVEHFGEQGFGPEKTETGGLIPYSRAKPGCLRVDSAHLPAADRHAIVASENKTALINQLFRNLQSTEIDRSTGAAKNKSLRLEQVAVPLTLEFEVTRPDGNGKDGWQAELEKALPLVRAVGQKRTRGLGRAVFEV